MKCKQCGNKMWRGRFLIGGCLAYDGWMCNCGKGHSEDGTLIGDITVDLTTLGSGKYISKLSSKDVDKLCNK